MGKLQVLPAQIANMIAAGEVVGRPASVVKELMENAIDAGSTQVTVVVTDAGRTLVQVIDNGCGMSEEDAKLCFERHATSKIATPEDLEQIATFGFRGEALASIAAVAEITLRTRRPEDETGTQVTIGNFGVMETTECSAPSGTNIAVRNLFYNTPARRKFLKSDNVELKHIIEEFTHVALTRPEIGFTLTHNGRDMFVLKKAKGLKFRIQDLLGASVVGDLVDIDAQTSLVSIHGFLGRPESAKKTLGNQFFFVNGRYFRSPYFHKAVMNAYSEMVPEGVTPSYFLYLDVDPHSIDVNISPTKTEIKFEEDSVIFQTIYACVRETLGRNSFGASIDFDTDGAVEMPQISRSFSEYKNSDIAPSHDFDPDYNPFDATPGGPSSYPGSFPSFDAPAGGQAGSGFGSEGYVHKQENYGALFEQKTLPATQSIILGGKYIATPVTSGMMLVNIRRAQVRILYEKMLRALKSEEHVTQTALFPVQVQIGAAHVPVIEEYSQALAKLGFDIVPFGTDTVVVNGVPEGYSADEMSVRAMVADLLQVLEEEHRSLPEMMQSAMARKFAELGAAKYETLKNSLEASRLMDDLFACDNADLTPSGQHITCIVPIEDIEKRF